jgi:hypothetical protein
MGTLMGAKEVPLGNAPFRAVFLVLPRGLEQQIRGRERTGCLRACSRVRRYAADR